MRDLSRDHAPGVDSQSDSQAVMGFTEAELGLMLAMVFMVLWMTGFEGSKPERPEPEPTQPTISQDSAARLLAHVAVLTARLDSLKAKRSVMAPSCSEAR